MARVIAIGQPVNDDERKAIAYLRDHLPDTYTVVHNFEILHSSGETFEVDIALLAPHAVYLIDVKGTRGVIDVYGSRWYPEGRQPYSSPVSKLKGHSRTLKGIITSSHPTRPDLENIYTDAAVILTAPNAQLIDRGGRDGSCVTPLRQCEQFFQNASRIPGRFSRNIGGFHSIVLRALQVNSRPRSGPLQFGNWIVSERLGGPEEYIDYRATNAFAGPNSGMVLLRAYKADPYLPEDERAKQKTRIKNAYVALNRMPPHPNILGVRDFFPNESEDRFFLVTYDTPGRALKLHLEKPNLSLTFDQKVNVAIDILSALEHAHANQVVHRNLNPSTVLVGTDGRVYLVGFDYARTGSDRSYTIANEITEELERDYQAPECQGNPSLASYASDVFAAGLLLYELFVGIKPFAEPAQIREHNAVFPVKPSERRPELPVGFDQWLQNLCTLEIRDRPTASASLNYLKQLMTTTPSKVPEPQPLPAVEPPDPEPTVKVNYDKLDPGYEIGRKYVVNKRLGKGGYGVVYKVIDTLGDMPRALKLILRDRHSVLERLKKEYRTLLRVPNHPYVVKVIEADWIASDGTPYIVFEYVDGLDVGEMIDYKLFSPEDGLKLAVQVAEGLVHLHRHGIYHCDIKPRNLLWSDNGVRILDFNVSVIAERNDGQAGGTRRYIPPDLDLEQIQQPADLVDRDLYALGITLYEAVTGTYPWETTSPPPGQPAKDPKEYSGLTDLEPLFADFILKAISPKRSDRFSSANEMLNVLATIKQARQVRSTTENTVTLSNLGDETQTGNPFVRHLLTLYSQSKRSNAGTRGLDVFGQRTYVSTLLDDELLPAVLNGEFKLVIITGNAGDGKTAFLQQLENRASEVGAVLDHSQINGCRISLNGRTYLSNYDGSQDEGNRTNDDVLDNFFAPFEGDDDSQWQVNETRLIAINEGRLIDFLESRGDRFARLHQLVVKGLTGGQFDLGVAVVNLNLRTVVSSPRGETESIFDRQIRRFTHEKFWEPCKQCEIADRCYALHNAQTLQDLTAGPKVIERLKTLYTLIHLRSRLHITLRDLRSALSYMLTSNRDCEEIKQLYASGQREAILDSYYFNSWRGGKQETNDRLLKLLRSVDIGLATDARLDRELDFVNPSAGGKLFSFKQRSSYNPETQCSYDRELLRSLFDELPRNFAGQLGHERIARHRHYLAAVRRRFFFEQQREQWWSMLPYRSAPAMLDLIQHKRVLPTALSEVLLAINRGEGLSDPSCLDGDLALQVREVDEGSVRSYRIFSRESFELLVQDSGGTVRFIEYMPSQLVLRYHGTHSNDPELPIDLDMFEMLDRLNHGYKPSIEQIQGYYLSLIVFKNLLASAPYREVLLTMTGHDFYRVQRHDDGRLQLAQLGQEV